MLEESRNKNAVSPTNVSRVAIYLLRQTIEQATEPSNMRPVRCSQVTPPK